MKALHGAHIAIISIAAMTNGREASDGALNEMGMWRQIYINAAPEGETRPYNMYEIYSMSQYMARPLCNRVISGEAKIC